MTSTGGDQVVQGLLILVLFVGVAIVLFLLVRAFWLWYWKINEIVDLLKDIRGDLRATRGVTLGPVAPGAQTPTIATSSYVPPDA